MNFISNKVDNLFLAFFENLCHKRNSTKRFWWIINFIVPSNLPTHIHTPYYLFIVLRTLKNNQELQQELNNLRI